jgi:hypothetical protein
MSGQVQTATGPAANTRDLDRGRRAVVDLMRAAEVTAADVAELRRVTLARGFVSRDEAEALFSLEGAPVPKCEDWTAFFVEAITTHVVWEARPTGVVNEAQGEWLIHWADRASSLNGLAVLVNVLAEAHRVPLWFLAVVRSRG